MRRQNHVLYQILNIARTGYSEHLHCEGILQWRSKHQIHGSPLKGYSRGTHENLKTSIEAEDTKFPKFLHVDGAETLRCNNTSFLIWFACDKPFSNWFLYLRSELIIPPTCEA